MLSIPQYLLESSFCLAIFYGFYHLFLKKETFFQLNRAYLLATPIAALSIPLLNISFQKDAPPESLEAFFYPAIQSANRLNEVVWEQMRAPSPVFSLSVADVIMAIYLMGIFLMSFSLLKGLWNLGRIIRRGKRSKNNEFTLVETQNNFPAASFFGYIFWNQEITDEQKLILEHEKVHIRQWHSLDVLLMEICVIIKWFNPLIYWFRNALKATHEFIADQYVIQQKSNVSEYATLLVNQHKQQIATPLTNTFYSMTKKRLQMMIQRPSQKVYAAKYLLVFPLIIGMMGLFSFNLLQAIPQVGEGLAEMNTVLENIGDKTVFEIEQSDNNALMAASEAAVQEHLEVLANTFENVGTNCLLYWADLEIALNKENSQSIPIIEVPINQFLASYQKEPIAALKIGGLFEEVSFRLYSYVIGESNLMPCTVISNTNKPAIFKENACIQQFMEQLTVGTLVSGDDLQIGGEGQRYKFQLRLIDPKAKRPNPDGDFTFKWGGIEFPIELRKEDFNTVFHVETVDLNDLRAALNQPIIILENGQIANGIQDILINLGTFIPTSTNTETYENFATYLPPSKVLLEGNGKSISEQVDVVKLMDLVDEKAGISFNINGFDFAGMIRVEDGKYQSPIQISKKEANLFNFQVIIPDEAKTILKIDTTLVANKSIVDMYRNPEKYDIIHIPNFKTATRSVVGNPTNADPVFGKSHRTISSPFFKTSKETEVDDKLLKLPEYVGYKPSELILKWGELTANPRSKNYDLKTFLENFNTGLQLNHLLDDLVIKQLRVVIAKKDAPYLTFDNQLPNLKDLHKTLSNLSIESSIYFDKIIINKSGRDYYLPQHFLFAIGKKAIASVNKGTKYTPNKSAKNLLSIDTIAYYNQMTLGKKNLEDNLYEYRMGKYKLMDKNLPKVDFGRAGKEGIYTTFFQHKDKKKRLPKGFEQNLPLQLVYFGEKFYFCTHKLSFDNFDANALIEKELYEPNSGLANMFGESGQNGVVIIRLAVNESPQKKSKTEKTKYGQIDTYELKWGKHDLPIILNKNSNSTVARFMIQTDFEASIKKPFEILKNGRKLKNKTIELTLFNTKNGSSWGIDKINGLQFKYWEFIRGEHAAFTLNSSKKTKFTKEEIAQIKSLVEEEWLLTIRAIDDYQLYSSISVVEPNSILLTRQYEPIPDGIPIQY